MSYQIAALYRFATLENLSDLKDDLGAKFSALNLCGTLLLAPEGINGTLAGTESSIHQMVVILGEYFGLPPEDVKFSTSLQKPFNRLKIRLKNEIITFKQTDADPSKHIGTYVDADRWNELLSDPDVLVLDTRNRYETMIGSFAGALDPQIDTFTEFADYVRSHLDPANHKKIAIYCTGGIRCEKASSFMLSQGFSEVFHLKGGILKYLEKVDAAQSRWNGECYVFDRRVAVGHALSTGRYCMCFTCGAPLTAADTQHPDYEEGVSCAHCSGTISDSDKERFRMRQAQINKQEKKADSLF
jgi:UPF0176 protein